MATRVDSKLAALIPLVSEPQVFVPIELQTEVDALSAIMLLDDIPEETKADYERAKQQAEEQQIGFKFRHVTEQRHREIRDLLNKEKLRYLKDTSYREMIREELLLSLESEPEEMWIEIYLTLVGKGEGYIDEEQLKTPRVLLASIADRIQEEFAPTITSLGTEETQVLLDELISAIGMDAEQVDYDDFEQDFIVHLTEQERASIADMDEDSPEYEKETSRLRDEAFQRHLNYELDRRKKEVERLRAEAENLGKDRVLNRIVNAAVDSRVDDALREMYVGELVAECTLTEAEDKWVKAFDSREDVESIKQIRPDLYQFLCDHIGQRMPRSIQSLVMSSPFRTGVV